MNKRLQQFLSAENISQSQLADRIGVAKASVSHILAGRNKPGFEFIEGLSREFPNLSLEWLIAGRGRMYKAPGRETEILHDLSPAREIPASGEDDLLFKDIQENEAENASADEAAVPRRIAKVMVFYDNGTFTELV